MIPQILSFSFLLMALCACGLWPYKSDFDCPVPEGEQCQSLYETNLKADAGAYAPSFLRAQPASAKPHSSPSPCKAFCSACASKGSHKVRV